MHSPHKHVSSLSSLVQDILQISSSTLVQILHRQFAANVLQTPFKDLPNTRCTPWSIENFSPSPPSMWNRTKTSTTLLSPARGLRTPNINTESPPIECPNTSINRSPSDSRNLTAAGLPRKSNGSVLKRCPSPCHKTRVSPQPCTNTEGNTLLR